MDETVTIEELVEQHQAAMYRLALSLLDEPAEAEDATQDIFLAAHRGLKRFRGDSSIKTWLYAIGTNVCRKRLRRRKVREALPALLRGEPREADTWPERDAIRNQTNTDLWAAVDNLREAHRLPIILRYVHDLTAPEIAKVMGISEGTVYSRIHYAQKKLKGQLERDRLFSASRVGS